MDREGGHGAGHTKRRPRGLRAVDEAMNRLYINSYHLAALCLE